MIIRPYQTADCEALARLFYDTVHTVNAKDYTEQPAERMGHRNRRPGSVGPLFDGAFYSGG